ncbi:cAMP-specific 3',5'-cyclic phosphodiesterase 4D isoform X8 [Tachysurus ichikawai]
MSLPVSSELCSLERVARYRSACINGSPYAINKPIDIKGRRRCFAWCDVLVFSSQGGFIGPLSWQLGFLVR